MSIAWLTTLLYVAVKYLKLRKTGDSSRVFEITLLVFILVVLTLVVIASFGIKNNMTG